MSPLYAESSAVLRWLLQHEASNRIEKALTGATDVVTSRLTGLEVARTLHRLTSTRQISPAERISYRAAYQAVARHWKTYAVADEILERAGEPLPSEPVRSLDAIHLATALVYSQAVAPLTFLSTDERLRDNAVALGLRVLP